MPVDNVLFRPYRPQRLSQTRQQRTNQRDTALNVLRQAQNQFGKVNSSTYLDMKAMQHKADIKYCDVCSRMKEKSKELSERIAPSSEFYYYRQNDPQLISINKSKKENGTLIGNCGECAEAVQFLFLENGQTPALNICMNMHDKEGNFKGNHVFTITNFPDLILGENPKTWGDETIITDLWSSISMKKKDAFNYYEKIFGTDLKKADFYLMPAKSGSLQEYWMHKKDVKPLHLRF